MKFDSRSESHKERVDINILKQKVIPILRKFISNLEVVSLRFFPSNIKLSKQLIFFFFLDLSQYWLLYLLFVNFTKTINYKMKGFSIVFPKEFGFKNSIFESKS